MEFFCTKVDGVLIGADAESAEKLANLGLDTVVKCSCKRNRNYENHKRYFKFIEIAFEMQNHFEDIEHFRKWLVMKAGYYETIVAPNGNIIFLPQSIAFEKIEEEDFKILFKKCIGTMIKEFSLTLTYDQFWELCEFD